MQSIHTLGIIALVVSSLIEFTFSEPRVVCYYTNWSVYRPGTAKFNPQNINPYLCTHLIYAFGGFTKDNQLKPFDKYQDIEQGGYAKFTGLKTYNKELKTMLAIGGWNEGSTRFSPLVASSERRSQLVKNAIKFLRQNKFDGLDLDWEYPAFRDGGKAKDRDNYAKLVQELREEFQREHDKTGRPRLLLTMAVPAGFEYIEKGYDVPKLNKHLDWFNILSYDYHSAYEPSVNHHAPLYPIEEENEYSYDTDLNINSTINFYVKAGADREKLVLGIPTYGRSYTLFNEESNEIGAPADGPGEQGDATREKGYLAYYEICQSLNEEDSDWSVVQPNPDALGPYAVSGNQWVGYDDEDIVRKKSKFVVEQNLGGIMFWSIDNDDFRGLCNGKAYPLIEAAKEAYLDSLANGVPTRNAIGTSKPKQTKVATTTKRPESSKPKSGGKFTTPPPPTTPDPGSDFKCEDEGFYAHPRDCKKYFWCLEAAGLGIVAHQFTCPSGLYFNKAADSCDYSRNVHCSKAEVTTSTTTTEEPYTTTTRASVSTRANPLYKSPSRTTTARTTTASYVEPITDFPELDQEDPSVIKELIDLIRKVGGVEELERQLNLQEDGASVTITQKSNALGSTTPASIISKSLYDKIKNRASVLKTRPNFNGASQPESALEKTEAKEQKSSERKTTSAPATEASAVSKKYNSVNRFSRPSSQSAGIESIAESDAVLIEKPQYTSIRRKPAVKPAVISENDYNGDSDNSREESTTEKPQSDSQKKYASINRSRRPQVQAIVEDDDESVENEEVAVTSTTTTTAKPTSKYLNLSRRRSTTESPEIERTEAAVETTTTPFRRRTPAPTQKTVLNLSNNRNQIQTNSQDIKDTSRVIQKETLTGNSLREEFDEEDDDEDTLNNVIALPTESVTENVPYPENILTTQPPPPPTTPPNSIQVTESLIQTESLNDIADNASNEIDDDTTTSVNDLYISESGGLSKQNEVSKSIERVNSLAPRPFSRPSLTRTRAPIVNDPVTQRTSEATTTRRVRTRPTVKFTTESSLVDNEIESTSRSQYTYRPGYRGTARFRTSTVRSGQYDRLQEDLKLSNFQPIENNRLRALNLEKLGTRPETSPAPEVTRRRLTPKARPSTTTTEASVEQEEKQSTRRRLTTRARFGSTSTAAAEVDDETTTEQRIVEAKNYFNLAAGERPDRIRFELALGKKIDFGVTPAGKTKSKTSESDPSKVKVLTGPLDKSPIVSSRDYKKGHVEEIPLANIQTTESVTVQSFSDKLDLSEIPLNKSDIESFVADEDLRTDSPIGETTRKQRLRPSIKGFARPQSVTEDDEEVTTQETEEETSTPRTKLRPNRIGLAQRTSTQEPTTAEASPVESSSSRSRFAIGKTRFPPRGGKLETVKSDEEVSADDESTSRRTRPLAFQNRLSQRTRTTESSVDENEHEDENSVDEEVTSKRARPLAFQNRFSQRSKTTENPDAGESVGTRARPAGFRSRVSSKSEIDISDNVDEDTSTARTRPSILRSRFTTKSPVGDSQAEDSISEDVSSSLRPTAFRTLSNKVTDRPKFRLNQKLDDSYTEESTTSRVRFRPSQTKFLQRVNAEDLKIEDVNDLQTESPFEDTTLNFFNLLSSAGSRFAAASSNSVEDFESYSLVTALPDKIQNNVDDDETDLTTNSNRESENEGEEDEDETTLNSLIDTTSSTTRSVVIRKRPVKKGDAVATRQTITETADEETSLKPEAKIEDAVEKNEKESNVEEEKSEDYKDIELGEEKTKESVATSTQTIVRSRPTRKLLTRVRVTTEAPEEDSQDAPEVSSSPRTTRKRIVFTRPRQNVRTSETSKDENVEKTEENNSNNEESSSDILNEEEASKQNIDAPQSRATLRTRPTRKVLTRVRVTTEAQEKDSQETPEIVPSQRTTRKRIFFTRPKQSTTAPEDGGENEENQLSETSEKSVAEETSGRTNDFAARRKVKVFKTKPSTERSLQVDEPTNSKIFTTRTRVFKRPVVEANEQKPEGGDFELKSDDESSTPRSNSRFGSDRQRKILKIKKLVVPENEEALQPESETSSTAAPKKRLYKVLRTKTPKLLADRPLTDDSSLIKTDNQSQDLDNENSFPENDQRFDNEENSENAGDSPEEQSAKPLLRFPTRPNSANRVVTIKRRPAFNLNSRTSTIHPASAKFGKDPQPTKARQVTIKRKFKPTAQSGSDSTTDDIEPEKRIALGERNKKIFSKGYRKSLSTTQAPNITPLTDTETTEPDDVVDTTDIPLDNNDENILQKDTSAKPRFSLSRFTTTTIRPTTLHHVFAIDVDEDESASKNKTTIKENNADEVIKKLQKLIEINRIVEVYSKEEKHKLLKNKKLKSIKQTDLTVERPPSIDKFGEISRETIIKLVKRNETVSTTEQPAVNQTRSPKNVVFAETVFSELESSTISLEGLFDREKKSNDDDKPTTEAADLKVSSSTHLRAPVPLLRPESNETNPIIISLKSLDKVILKKVQTPVEPEREEITTTESPSEDTTLVDDN